MNKKDFINKLSLYLGGVPAEERQDVINDIEEHFKEAISEGRTEEEISDSLGDPKALANQFKANILVDKAEKTASAINITRAVLATLGLGFFNLVFILGPFIGIASIVFSLFAAAIAIAATGIAVFFASIFGPLVPQYVAVMINPAVSIFASIGVTLFGILFFIGNIYMAKWVYRLFVRYIKFNVRIITGKE
ncbi:MAG: DUF1700 domain-containing protein [Actinomycetota bacterium]